MLLKYLFFQNHRYFNPHTHKGWELVPLGANWMQLISIHALLEDATAIFKVSEFKNQTMCILLPIPDFSPHKLCNIQRN